MRKRIICLTALLALVPVLLSGCTKREESAVLVTPTPDPYAGTILVSDGSGGYTRIWPAEDMEEFEPDRTAFSVTDGVMSYSGEGWSLRRGVDVSVYQGEIDWQTVADAGIEFALIRCGNRGTTEGGLYEDEYFRRNLDGARKAGLDVGVYFFSQAVSDEEAEEEAAFVLELLDGEELTLPVYFDWEPVSGETRSADVSGETVTSAALVFCEVIRKGGYEPGVYTYLYYAYNGYDLNSLAGLSIWMGDVGSYPDFYYAYDVWQYSFTGAVDGIPAEVDLDVIFVEEEK